MSAGRRSVESGQTPEAVSEALSVCPRTVRKWIKQFKAEGLAGLQERSSRLCLLTFWINGASSTQQQRHRRNDAPAC
jgi:transposase-like protein